MKILRKLPEIVLLVILFIIISRHSNESLNKDVNVSGQESVFSLETAKNYFTDASELQILSKDRAHVLNEKGKLVGHLLSTSPLADDIIGYASSVPVMIAIDSKDKITGVNLLIHSESPGFIRRIKRKNFFKSWDNMSVADALEADIDVVSGASMTTGAVKEGVNLRLAKYLEIEQKEKEIPWTKILAFAGSLFVLIFALLSFFSPKLIAKKRIFLLIASIAILGFWQGEFISLALMYGWLINGIPVLAKIFILVLVIISLVLPLFTNKAFYCTHVCPYGAAQELMGKLNKKKIKIPRNIAKYLRWMKMIFFYAIVLAVILRFEIDLSNFEPFSAFLVSVASPSAIVIATVFLIVSIFIPKAWCNYFCPTGYLLEVFRKSKL